MTEKLKIAIIYHSESGNTQKVAQTIAEGAKVRDDIEVKPMSITEVDEAFIAEQNVKLNGLLEGKPEIKEEVYGRSASV